MVPFQTRFDSVLKTHEPRDLAEDGVHPNERGHRLMANWWLEAIELGRAELDSVRTG